MWPKRRRISPWVWLWVGVGLLVLVYPAYKWHQAFSRTGSAQRAGEHIYAELKAIEPQVLSGKMADANAPELEAISAEIKRSEHDHGNESFQDAVIFSSLDQYVAGLRSIAISNAEPGQQNAADHAVEVEQLQRVRAEVEKSLR